MHTICALPQKFSDKLGQNEKQNASRKARYFANLAMKVNLKLGGVNQILMESNPHLGNTAMVMGIDVIHPTKNAMNSALSVAAFVASNDSNFAQWPVSYQTQVPPDPRDRGSGVEIVENINEIFKERMKFWRNKNNGCLPDKIIYRDGV